MTPPKARASASPRQLSRYKAPIVPIVISDADDDEDEDEEQEEEEEEDDDGGKRGSPDLGFDSSSVRATSLPCMISVANVVSLDLCSRNALSGAPGRPSRWIRRWKRGHHRG